MRIAAAVLGRIGGPASLKLLRQLVLESEQLPAGGRHLVLALGKLGSAADADGLLVLLGKTKRNDERRALCFAIGALAPPERAGELAKHWQKDKAQDFRAALLLALGRIGGDGALGVLREGLRSKKESIRRAATIAAADLREAVLLPELIRLLRDSDEDVVRHALRGLALQRSEKIPPAILRSGLLKTGESDIRALAVLALGAQEGELVDKSLAARMKPRAERQKDVLRALAFALGRVPGRLTDLAKRRLDAQTDPEVARALWCSRTLRNRQGASLILLALRQPELHDRLRLTLMELLAHVDPDEALSHFGELLEKQEQKKKVLERAEELRQILEGEQPGGAALIRARVQVEIDELGGSAEWRLLEAVREEMKRIEDIDRDFGSGLPGTRPGGRQKPPEPWTREEEDLRVWWDAHPYYDARSALDIDGN